MKKYAGVRGDTGSRVTVSSGQMTAPLAMRLDLTSHSPDGFEWGYGGSGPAQLALAILADYFGNTPDGDARALQLHQAFKRATVANIQAPSWEMDEAAVSMVVASIQKQGGR